MKKSIILIISLILLFTLLAITTSAAGATATVDNKSCAIGSTVTLNVNVSGASGVTSGAVEVVYDKSVLELVDAKWNTDGALLSTFDKATDKGAFAYQAEKNLSGKIFSVTFRVLDSAPIGKTDVECKIQLKNGSNDISVTNNKGSIDITCKHSFTEKNNQFIAGEASCTSPSTYYYACSVCGEKGSTTYTVGSALPHAFDKKVATTAYLVKSVTCVNEAEYYYSCSCGAKGSETFTADASWSHNFSDNWFISADGHWHQCLACGAKKDEANHTPNVNKTCEKCQFVTSDEAHYHEFGSAWLSSDYAHWYECSCGLKENLELHNWNDGVETKPATESEDGEKLYTCTDCGKTKTEKIAKLEPAPHQHSFGGDWIGSEDAHWHECSCGLKNDLELHNWDNGVETKPATEDKEGEKLFTCADCGKTKVEAIAKLEAPKSDESTDNVENDANSNSNANSGGNITSAKPSTSKIAIYVAGGIFALLVVEAIAFVIYKFVIKKKQNEISENNNNSESNSNEPEIDGSHDSVDSSEN